MSDKCKSLILQLAISHKIKRYPKAGPNQSEPLEISFDKDLGFRFRVQALA